MENLSTESVSIDVGHGPEEYSLQEKDFGDLVVYDIYRQDRYLLTLSRDGSILFMNFDADEKDKKIFKLSSLDLFIDKLAAIS